MEENNGEKVGQKLARADGRMFRFFTNILTLLYFVLHWC